MTLFETPGRTTATEQHGVWTVVLTNPPVQCPRCQGPVRSILVTQADLNGSAMHVYCMDCVPPDFEGGTISLK